MAAILNGGELTLSGAVGADWFEDGFNYTDVVLALAQIDEGAPLLVRINSGGGIASEGNAIHALLKGRAGHTDVLIEGIAASSASLIAMAGSTVVMALGAVMMIHDPATITIGTSADHDKSKEMLETFATSFARVYAAKSEKTEAECRTLMLAETWLTAEQAVEAGFADQAGEQKAVAEAAFDYRVYAHAPKRLKAMAKRKNWSMPTDPAASAGQNRQPKEIPMTDKERADALAAELAELKAKQVDPAKASADAIKADRERRAAIMALDETKGREALAEKLHASTAMTVDEVKAILDASPTAETAAGTGSTAAYEQGRTTGADLKGKGNQQPQLRVDLVAEMKRRHGLAA